MLHVLKNPIKKCGEAESILQRCSNISDQYVKVGNEILNMREAGREFADLWIDEFNGASLDRFLKVQKRLLESEHLLVQASSKLAYELFEIVYRDRNVDHA